ncbi:30S ribosomal protein S1 [Leptospira kanakyensis]|uniref:30S ribosomal protein S1 n=1 Tax=Leptospira kanakyensis TaxID=2484968 RepID=A0A6N4Q3T9_9LEPT|nr:hypothetical protein [Leptospira kanakyensis]TGK50042.1 30S ribosomal protein S1 [Leptospira kanakyensis]TGK58440.1 30S ribosomal protein S1 [Leptospira kanakyensis]TGK69180.1 30S ribosomal protein S1 [Leptospira kanakyensis]
MKIIYLFLFFLFLCSSFALQAAKIQFFNGDVFFAELVSEDERFLIVKFKSRNFKIPKKEIEFSDIANNSASDTSYTLSVFSLRDGSKIKGALAEEKKTEFVFKTEIGFLVVLKSEILPPYPTKVTSPEMDSKYLLYEKDENRTLFGGSLFLLPTYQPLAYQHPYLIGGSIFTEPAYLKLNHNWQGGVRIENYQSKGKLSILSGSVYILNNGKLFNWDILSYYTSFGLGISQVSYTSKDNQSYSGQNTIISFDFGWQKTIFLDSFLRIGIKNTCFLEPTQVYCGSGLEMQTGVFF